jgi:hypothetical protein
LRSRSAGECKGERKLIMIMHLRCEIELQMSMMLKSKYYGQHSMSRKFKYRCLDPCGCHGELEYSSTDGIIYGRCNHPAHADDGGLASHENFGRV